MQKKKKQEKEEIFILKFKNKVNFATCVLRVYFHQIERVKFIYNGQTIFLPPCTFNLISRQVMQWTSLILKYPRRRTVESCLFGQTTVLHGARIHRSIEAICASRPWIARYCNDEVSSSFPGSFSILTEIAERITIDNLEGNLGASPLIYRPCRN